MTASITLVAEDDSVLAVPAAAQLAYHSMDIAGDADRVARGHGLQKTGVSVPCRSPGVQSTGASAGKP